MIVIFVITNYLSNGIDYLVYNDDNHNHNVDKYKIGNKTPDVVFVFVETKKNQLHPTPLHPCLVCVRFNVHRRKYSVDFGTDWWHETA